MNFLPALYEFSHVMVYSVPKGKQQELRFVHLVRLGSLRLRAERTSYLKGFELENHEISIA
jgi:hypothetical protein